DLRRADQAPPGDVLRAVRAGRSALEPAGRALVRVRARADDGVVPLAGLAQICAAAPRAARVPLWAVRRGGGGRAGRARRGAAAAAERSAAGELLAQLSRRARR